MGADLERRVGLLEKALVEQGKVIAVLKKERQEMQNHINDLHASFQESVGQLWENQQAHDVQLMIILNVLDPENYPLPEELKEELDAQPDGETPQEGTTGQVH